MILHGSAVVIMHGVSRCFYAVLLYIWIAICRDVSSIIAVHTSDVEWRILHVLQLMNLETDLLLWLKQSYIDDIALYNLFRWVEINVFSIFIDKLWVLLDLQSDSANKATNWYLLELLLGHRRKDITVIVGIRTSSVHSPVR